MNERRRYARIMSSAQPCLCSGRAAWLLLLVDPLPWPTHRLNLTTTETFMLLNADLSRPAAVDSETLDWIASPMAGVERRMLERDGDEVARATSLVRYAPGSSFAPHTHGSGEEFLVLDGVFSDETGDFRAREPMSQPTRLSSCRTAGRCSSAALGPSVHMA
jgi:ChrR Cupin-like domain